MTTTISFPKMTTTLYVAQGPMVQSYTTGSCSTVSDKELLLLDSGAQFTNGTTDITRTVHLGEPSARQKECFTRVLQVLDMEWELQRMFMKVLKVSAFAGHMTSLQKGMILSNEPGEDHLLGLRIENLLHTKAADTPNHFGGIEYLGFEKLTFFPIQTELIDPSLLSPAEVKWVR